ncbi:hypothetical protein OFQ56_10745 [Brachyspira hyodysenteriae]|nr:hypothetical protein [Brachyspira hyodysenteriae]MCZ9948277.1 hypothetical protein [Brachyspira hyodysenteriae]
MNSLEFTAQKFDTFERYSPTKKIDEIEEEIEKDEDLVNIQK